MFHVDKLARNFFVVFASFFLLLGPGCGKDDAKNTENGEQPALTDVSQITDSADRRSLVGRHVDIPSAPAGRVTGFYVFWAGAQHSAVPVVRGDKINGPISDHVKNGETVRITGTVRLLESVDAADPMWQQINEDERRDIMGAIVYIYADEIQVIK